MFKTINYIMGNEPKAQSTSLQFIRQQGTCRQPHALLCVNARMRVPLSFLPVRAFADRVGKVAWWKELCECMTFGS